MFIDQLSNADEMPVLRAAAQFAARRQTLIASNIANFSTPGYQEKDVSPQAFQAQLAKAVDARRDATGGSRGSIDLATTDEVRSDPDGNVVLTPKTPSGNILFHDRNDRDLERTMAAMAENVASFRLATDLLKNRAALLDAAIRERP